MSYVKPSYNSPLPSIENKNLKEPKYIMKSDAKVKSKEINKIDRDSIDTMSDYVKENLNKLVKPRNKEYR